ncbi:hypothetical protein SAMN02910264_02134 [Ruminococcaceae bacterium YAD3003]|nr:hypothetical protein SAMN02910264_02134 [Ruminococcaceae bacterium YAD3003]
MNNLISLNEYPVKPVLKMLLADKTTKQNIVFATDSYSSLGDAYQANRQIDTNLLMQMGDAAIQPRVLKSLQDQADRTKSKAEVMTPAWIVNKMNNYCDEDWFGRPSVFNVENGERWTTNTDPIIFPEGKDWQQYVTSMRIEITCGEAPYLVSRYDTTKGKIIIPVKDRVGVLDRKLRIVKENTSTKEEWLKWAIKAYESTYGFEYQGDNLLIGRINLLITFVDYMQDKWNENPTDAELRKVANIIVWNLWQMDGLTGTVPFAYREVSHKQLSFFDFIDGSENETVKELLPALIYDWKKKCSVTYNSLKESK